MSGAAGGGGGSGFLRRLPTTSPPSTPSTTTAMTTARMTVSITHPVSAMGHGRTQLVFSHGENSHKMAFSMTNVRWLPMSGLEVHGLEQIPEAERTANT